MIDVAPETQVSWGAAYGTCPGETNSGDLAVVHRVPEGTLFAAVDGAGHGDAAAHAARRAATQLEALAGHGLEHVVARTHDALRNTRGAAMAVAFVRARADRLSWMGIGNVTGLVLRSEAGGLRAGAWLRMPGGVAGHELPAGAAAAVPLRHGDVLILATDGVSATFADDVEPAGRPQDIADRILRAHWTGTDDAVVLAVRFLGGAL